MGEVQSVVASAPALTSPAPIGVTEQTAAPTATRAAASVRAAAHWEEIFGLLPFAARVAFASACLRTARARLSSLLTFFGGLVAA